MTKRSGEARELNKMSCIEYTDGRGGINTGLRWYVFCIMLGTSLDSICRCMSARDRLLHLSSNLSPSPPTVYHLTITLQQRPLPSPPSGSRPPSLTFRPPVPHAFACNRFLILYVCLLPSSRRQTVSSQGCQVWCGTLSLALPVKFLLGGAPLGGFSLRCLFTNYKLQITVYP